MPVETCNERPLENILRTKPPTHTHIYYVRKHLKKENAEPNIILMNDSILNENKIRYVLECNKTDNILYTHTHTLRVNGIEKYKNCNVS